MSELFDAVDALVASRSPLPPPAERRRLRQAHALTLDEVAATLQVRRATVGAWESGKTEPRPPEREAYARLLEQLATLYPAREKADAEQEDSAVPQPPAPPAADSSAAAPSSQTVSPPKATPSEASESTAACSTIQPPKSAAEPIRRPPSPGRTTAFSSTGPTYR
ncbi:DNA-binding transcriptional regulator YiaG [Streptomyces tendae]